MSYPVSLSADGRYFLFNSSATDLVSGQVDTNGTDDAFLYDRVSGAVTHVAEGTGSRQTGTPDLGVFLYDRITGANQLVSHTPSSTVTPATWRSESPVLSAEGRWIAFESESEDLSTEDCNARSDVFLYDRDGALQIVSRRHPDMPSLTGSWASVLATHAYPVSALSDDGRFVAFVSGTTNLVEGVTGYNSANVFLRDRQTGETVLVSASAAIAAGPGRPANHDSTDLALSADGRWVAFLSKATDLVPGQVDTAVSNDVFLFDRVSRSVTLVSRSADSAVTTGNNASVSLGLSSDGRYVAFTSSAKTLVPGASYPFTSPSVYLQDRWADVTTLVSRRNGPTLTAGNGSSPLLSLDGRFLAYESLSADLVLGQSDANGTWDVFLYDRVLDANSLVSHVPGAPLTTGNDLSSDPRISPEGTYVAFESSATNLVPGQTDSNADLDVFLHDRRIGENTLVSHAAGSPATAVGGFGSVGGDTISGDGAWVVFSSSGTNVVPGQADANAGFDVFLLQRATGATTLVSHAAGSATATGAGTSFPYGLSGDQCEPLGCGCRLDRRRAQEMEIGPGSEAPPCAEPRGRRAPRHQA